MKLHFTICLVNFASLNLLLACDYILSYSMGKDYYVILTVLTLLKKVDYYYYAFELLQQFISQNFNCQILIRELTG